MANYTVRMCIAQGVICASGDIAMQNRSNTYQEEQVRALNLVSYDMLYLKSFIVLVALLLIILSIVSSIQNPLWFNVAVPTGGPNKDISKSLENVAWKSTKFKVMNKPVYGCDHVAQIQKTALLDNMYRCSTLIGTWVFIIIADYHTLELAEQLLPPSLPYAQIIGKISSKRIWKSVLTVVFAAIAGTAVWSGIITNYIPTMLGILDDESDSVQKDTYRSEIRKATIKRAESWFDKTLDSILAVAVVSITRAILVRVAYRINYTSVADYNALATIIALPFVIDIPIYAITLLGSVVTLGLSVAQYITVIDYVKTKENHADLQSLQNTPTKWLAFFLFVNNPLISVYYIHFNIFPTFAGTIATVVFANIVGALTSKITGLFVAFPLGALVCVFAYILTQKSSKD